MEQRLRFYFKHPKHTDNQEIEIGANAVEALHSLEVDYGLDLEEVLDVCLAGFAYQKEIV
jgi:hypothetical protein